MSDLIRREDATNAIYHHFPSMTMKECANVLHEVPSAQPERKVGKWIEVKNKWGGLEIICSECGAKVPRDEWGKWFDCIFDKKLDSLKITAWMPCPKPWRGEEE